MAFAKAAAAHTEKRPSNRTLRELHAEGGSHQRNEFAEPWSDISSCDRGRPAP